MPGLLVKGTAHCFWQPWQSFWCPFSEEFVQQINRDWALVFWHLSTGTDYKHRNGRSLCLAGLILTLISIHVFKDCCRNLSFTFTECVVCVGRGGEWQHARPSYLAVTGVNCGRMQRVNMCVCCSSVSGFDLPPTEHQMLANLSLVYKSINVTHLIGWLLKNTITFKWISLNISEASRGRLVLVFETENLQLFYGELSLNVQRYFYTIFFQT